MQSALKFFFFLMLSFNAEAFMSSVDEESYYNQLREKILSGSPVQMLINSSTDQKVLVDVLWDLKNVEGVNVESYIQEALTTSYELSTTLRLIVLSDSRPSSAKFKFMSFALSTRLTQDRELATLVLAHQDKLAQFGFLPEVEQAREHYLDLQEYFKRAERGVGDQSAAALELWVHRPDLENYLNAKYAGGIKLYMFCRTQRQFPCIMLAKDSEDRVVLDKNGDIWHQPALASSASNIPSHTRNGNTPAGVHHIDGVMPAADQQISFGKFRRLILNFTPKSANENVTRTILPANTQDQWWMPAVVARDVGRSLLRIHGTGKINQDPTSSWFPFMRTSGCVAQRENTYDGIEYRDQENLLEILMSAQGLEPEFSNHPMIKGLFYIIDINDRPAPVTLSELTDIGIGL